MRTRTDRSFWGGALVAIIGVVVPLRVSGAPCFQHDVLAGCQIVVRAS